MFGTLRRFQRVWRMYRPSLVHGWEWARHGREVTNFTYPITDRNRIYTARLISAVVERPVEEIEGYFSELESDDALRDYVVARLRESSWGQLSDDRFDPGRRMGWYALARALKPQVVVESGCERGYGAVCLISALIRNGTGYYYGLDISQRAGWLISGDFKDHGEVIYGDALENLRAFDKSIDLYVNDSDHRLDYEAAEYELIEQLLSARAAIVSDNAHVTTALETFARKTNRRFLFLADEPIHWTKPAGIGVAW